jgi:hypothetical protein
MFYTDYVLKDNNKLPNGAKFIDPYDAYNLYTEINDTLDIFLGKINNRRISISQPTIDRLILEPVVVSMLYESSNDTDRNKYFRATTSMATIANIKNVAKAMYYQAKNNENVPLKTQKERATMCGGCAFNDKNSSWTAIATQVVNSISSTEDLVDFPEKQNLGSCLACGGCDLKAKVGYGINSLVESLSDDSIEVMSQFFGLKNFVSKCFILKEGIESPNTKQKLISKLTKLNKYTVNG